LIAATGEIRDDFSLHPNTDVGTCIFIARVSLHTLALTLWAIVSVYLQRHNSTMKSTVQALAIAAIFATPLSTYAQASQPLTQAPVRTAPVAADQGSPSAQSLRTPGHSAATDEAGFGGDPRGTSQTGGSGDTTVSSYSPPIRIAR
jgi:hypothetical protein